jgi:hypothetical protein
MRKVTQTAIGKVGAWVSFGRLFVSREKSPPQTMT